MRIGQGGALKQCLPQAEHASPDDDSRATGVPLCNAMWRKAHDAMANANAHIMKAIIQSTIEHRAAALAATSMASRPGDIGLEAEAAASFCARMFA